MSSSSADKTYTLITETEHVTEEIMQAVREIESGWYSDSRIDWDDVWDRLDKTQLNDGTFIDMGGEFNTPAMNKIKRTIREERRYN